MIPKVSVIIPNYNHSPYLKARIDSVLEQTCQDFELILLDDCSPDNSRDILESYRKNEHVTHIIINEQNTGNTFLQWEKGIRLSQGEYIWIAESDDVAEPQLLETLLDELEKHPKAVVAYCHSQMIDSQGKPLDFTWHPHGSDGKTYVYDGYWFLRHRMLIHNHIYNASMTLFRKNVFSKVPNTYQHYRYCGDWLFWSHLCTLGEVIEVRRVLNLYRQHQNKVTNSSQIDGRKWIDNGNVLREISKLLRLNGLQKLCLRGRWTKRFLKENGNSLSQIRNQLPDIYGGTYLSTVAYEVGKLFGFLRI